MNEELQFLLSCAISFFLFVLIWLFMSYHNEQYMAKCGFQEEIVAGSSSPVWRKIK